MKLIAHITDNTSVDTSEVEVIETQRGGETTVQIYRVPEDDDYPDVDEFHDVVIRHEVESRDIHGPFDREEAAEHAVRVAEENGYMLVDRIYRLNQQDMYG